MSKDAPAVLGSGNQKNAITVGEIMPNISINTKIQPINLISNLGTQIEVDQETLDKWNKALSDWWNVQLEMDKAIQQKVRNDIQE